MVATTFADAIQNALVALAVARPFPVLSYAVAATGGAQSTDQSTTLLPATVLAWQDAQNFGEATRNRRDGSLRERVSWSWKLEIKFDRPVSMVEFEDAVLQSTPRVLRDLANGVDQQVNLLLEDAEYENPVTQQPSRGTKATYRFTAELTPY
jgi:hypothetical protein